MIDKCYSILVYILDKAGLFGKLNTSTVYIAEDLKSTQQTISRKLIEMQSLGLIKKQLTSKGLTISLDDKARVYLKKNYKILKKKIEKTKTLRGKVKSGIGEGKYYMSLLQYISQFKSKLGFKPYAGTLNLNVKNKNNVLEFIDDLEPILITGFKTKERTYGSISCYKVKIKNAEAAIAIPERTRHEQGIIEIISPVHLRSCFNLKDNEMLEVQK